MRGHSSGEVLFNISGGETRQIFLPVQAISNLNYVRTEKQTFEARKAILWKLWQERMVHNRNKLRCDQGACLDADFSIFKRI